MAQINSAEVKEQQGNKTAFKVEEEAAGEEASAATAAKEEEEEEEEEEEAAEAAEEAAEEEEEAAAREEEEEELLFSASDEYTRRPSACSDPLTMVKIHKDNRIAEHAFNIKPNPPRSI